MSASVCRGCGKRIIWGVTKEGTRIPLDPTPPIYEIQDKDHLRHMTLQTGKPDPLPDFPKDAELVSRAPIQTYMVSHFATCPKANDFSGGGRR